MLHNQTFHIVYCFDLEIWFWNHHGFDHCNIEWW